MKLKYELLDELFTIGGNFKPDESKIVKIKLQEYFKNNENDLQVRDALIILKTFEADYNYNDLKTCCELSIPIFERLSNTSEWSFYDIRILTYVVHYADTYIQSHALATKALKLLENHTHEKRYVFIKMGILINMTSRLLRAKFYEKDTQEADENISDLFSSYIDLIMPLCIGEDFIPHNAFAKVRKGLFYGDTDLINNTFKFLKEKGRHELYKVLQDELREYKYYVDLDKVSKKQFRIIAGENVKKIRLNRGLTEKDFADILDMSISAIKAIEKGETGITPYSILVLSETLNISTEEIYRGINVALFESNSKELLLEKINVRASKFKEDKLEFILRFIDEVDKLP